MSDSLLIDCISFFCGHLAAKWESQRITLPIWAVPPPDHGHPTGTDFGWDPAIACKPTQRVNISLSCVDMRCKTLHLTPRPTTVGAVARSRPQCSQQRIYWTISPGTFEWLFQQRRERQEVVRVERNWQRHALAVCLPWLQLTSNSHAHHRSDNEPDRHSVRRRVVGCAHLRSHLRAILQELAHRAVR